MTRAMKKCITLLTVISLLMGVLLLPAAAVEDVNIDNESKALTEASDTTEPCEGGDDVEALSENVKVGSRFWELFFGSGEPKRLIASGDVFGVKIKQAYASIVDAPGVPALRCYGQFLICAFCAHPPSHIGRRVFIFPKLHKLFKSS